MGTIFEVVTLYFFSNFYRVGSLVQNKTNPTILLVEDSLDHRGTIHLPQLSKPAGHLLILPDLVITVEVHLVKDSQQSLNSDKFFFFLPLF